MWRRRPDLRDATSFDALDDEYHDDVIDLRPDPAGPADLADDEFHDGTGDRAASALGRALQGARRFFARKLLL
ncbi:hypothetical protein [Poseidonocella sp. HB161398]|uniref:hypothetical protein n=1 Tax=Poseidonocella sp. HB161398 TaxID=2320855 RepID=UPI001109AC6A|nr:hypothetical protein [Poseidonocella sp. HB161398]